MGPLTKESFGEIQGFAGQVIAETRSDDGTRRITGVKVARALFALDICFAAHQVELRAGWPEPAGEPFVNDLIVTGDVSGDAIFGTAEDIGVFAIFVDDPFGTCS